MVRVLKLELRANVLIHDGAIGHVFLVDDDPNNDHNGLEHKLSKHLLFSVIDVR